MVTSPVNSGSAQTQQYKLTITLNEKNPEDLDAVLAALKPEFASIDSKRVALQVKSNQNQIVFHLAAKDVTALRAAATSLVRLYLVADGVHQFTVMKNG
jgi:tRNA threonylcarbamoyladenosine modification (KEOPS) complex  Pcc1 subunit